MLECVPNVSEGRDLAALAALGLTCGDALLDTHIDGDHHRTVFTLAGPGPRDAEAAVRRLAVGVAEAIDLRDHEGVHPRIGALDVVPFVALDEPMAEAGAAARSFAEWISEELAVPVFCYDAADPQGRSLPELRRDAWVRRLPDLGPTQPHVRLGAVAVGARSPLVAVNCWVDTDDDTLARSVAAAVRERDGGLPGVRALGFTLASRDADQVSMNLVDLHRTGLEEACTAVRTLVEAGAGHVWKVELVGLLPAAELARCSVEFLTWSGLGPDVTIEARLAAQGA